MCLGHRAPLTRWRGRRCDRRWLILARGGGAGHGSDRSGILSRACNGPAPSGWQAVPGRKRRARLHSFCPSHPHRYHPARQDLPLSPRTTRSLYFVLLQLAKDGIERGSGRKLWAVKFRNLSKVNYPYFAARARAQQVLVAMGRSKRQRGESRSLGRDLFHFRFGAFPGGNDKVTCWFRGCRWRNLVPANDYLLLQP